MPIRLAVVDDHILFRKTLVSYLSEQTNVEVFIQASDLTEILSKLRHSPIDLLIMDVFMPHLNGVDGVKIIRREYPEMKILVLSMSGDMNIISDMLESGIHGYLSKSDEPDNLVEAITAASQGRIYRNRLFTEALYWNKQNHMVSDEKDPYPAINDREKKILQLIWEEKSNKEIADQLFLGVRSVEKLRQDLKEKIGVKSTVGLLKYALNKSIINMDTFFSFRVSHLSNQ
jgi:DNA-binding NarL/FixJ family response regulator